MATREEEAAEAIDDEGRFEGWFLGWFATLARAMALVVRDFGDGQEIAQEAFLRLYRRRGQMQSDEHARRFVFRAAINLARSHLRRRLPLALLPSSSQEPLVPDVGPAADVRLDVARTLRRLSRRQREVVVLIDYLGFDDASVAELLGINRSTTRVHLARARRALRAALDNAQEGSDDRSG
jgi:RNA polymerase sigma factor (sigma-70 family)